MAQLEFSQPSLPLTALENQRERFKTYCDLICGTITDIIIIICLDYLLILNLPPNGYNNICVNQWFLTGGDFTPQGTLAISGDISGCHNLIGDTACATGIFSGEAWTLLRHA